MKRDWHREDIKAALRKKGVNMCTLANATGYSHQAFSAALVKPYPAVEMIIAGALDRHPKTIWPSRYLPDGEPRFPTRRKRKPNTKEGDFYVQRAMLQKPGPH